jgi:Secretion system C-terminal sorting domain
MKKNYVIFLLPMILAAASSLYAQTTSWNGIISSDWNNPSNWNAGVPNVTKDAFITNFGFNNPVISTSGAEAKSLYVSGGTSLTITSLGTLAINGGTTRGLYHELGATVNNSGFFIERSADGLHWNEIGFVGGNGTSNEPHTYTFTDKTPLSGPNSYRLRQTDFDGKNEFSDIATVKFSGSTSGFSVFPNPASGGYLTVVFTGETAESDIFVRIFNARGQVVQTDLLYGESGRIDMHSLTPGIYLLEASSEGKHFWEKVVLAQH